MPRSLAWKQEELNRLEDNLSNLKGIVLLDCKGMNVESMTNLRREFRANSVILRISKNTLIKKAIRDNPVYKPLIPLLKGPTAILFSSEDAIAPCAVLKKFNTKEQMPIIKGGVIEGSFFKPDALERIADLPPRKVLLAQVLNGLQSPVTGFVYVLNGLLRNFVSTLDELRKKREQS
jgi:large subunit ribosomal protein L10